MKKSVAAALAAAVVVGASSTSFAAMNPFSDVPAGHWAYQAVTSLAQEGVIEGYGDATYRGERTITRYEMAQMIAKALAKTDSSFAAESGINPGNRDGVVHQHATKADLDRLVEEFRPELEQLGVLEKRVNEMWKYSDQVIWQGKIEYTYKSARSDRTDTKGKDKINQDDWIFRFEPVVVVNGVEDPNGTVALENGHFMEDPVTGEKKRAVTKYKSLWTLRARIDAHADLSRDSINSGFTLERGWAQGDYKNFQVKVGRQPLYTNEDGIVWDTEYTGGEISFGNFAKGFKATIFGGRLNESKVIGSTRHAGYWDGRQDANKGQKSFHNGSYGGAGTDPSSFWAVNIQYDRGKGLFGGAGYYHIKDDDFMGKGPNGETYYSNNGETNKAKIWSVNAGYRIGKGQVWGAYANNTEADIEKSSWQALVKYGDLYGGGNQNTHKGQWAVWAGYKKLGSNASLCAINWDDAFAGTKGIVAGASWAPMDRVVFLAKYFKGKYIEGRGDAERLFGRVEFFF